MQLVAAAALAALLVAAVARAQSPDGDDQFQVFHEDIGRLSGQAAPVAPASLLVASPAPAPGPPPPQDAPRQVPAAPARTRPHRHQVQRVARPQAAPAEPHRAHQQRGPPQHLQDEAAGQVAARHAALVAQVAAERQALLAGQPHLGAAPEPQPREPAASVEPAYSGAGSLGQPSAAAAAPPPAYLEALSAAPAGPQAGDAAASAAAAASASQPVSAAALHEQLVAPSFEHVVSHGCPRVGVFSFEHKQLCDRYYLCTNGTFSEEACPNGLLYSQLGAVYQHCAYRWNVDCGPTRRAPGPLSSGGCPWQFGIFPLSEGSQCSIDYSVCEWGVPETRRCTPEGLFYDDRIKGCQWADQLGCKSEALLNFKCPSEDEDNPYWPYPRYYHSQRDVIVCVNEQPRLVHCNEDQAVEPSSLACVDLHKNKKQRRL